MLPPNTQGGFRTGSILGVDHEGGVSVALYAGPDPSIWTMLLASTVPGGGFRAIMAPPEFAAETGVVRKNVAQPVIGLRRCNMGYTRAIGFDAVVDQSYSIFSPDLTRRVIWRSDEPVPGGTARTGLIFLVSSSDFGIARNSDHAGFEAADLVPFLSFSTQTVEHGVMRTRETSAEMLLRSGSPINDLQMINRAKPLVSANSAGQTLVAVDRVLDTALGTQISEPLLLYSESGEPHLLLQRDDIIPFTNFQPRPYNPPRSDWIFRRMMLGDDGSVTFDISPESREIARRSPSGEYTMLIAPDAELLGVPGATIGTDGRVAKVTLSLDGTSAGSVYRINGTDTIVYAGPAGVTRI